MNTGSCRRAVVACGGGVSSQQTREHHDVKPFTEVEVWKQFDQGWRQLGGNFHEAGFSVEWHRFRSPAEFDWTASYHPSGLEVCLNLAGSGRVSGRTGDWDIGPTCVGYYFQHEDRLQGVRRAAETHEFVTIEFSRPYLERLVADASSGLPAGVRAFLQGESTSGVSTGTRLSSPQQQLVKALVAPPVPTSARTLWYQAKALEVAATVLFPEAEPPDLFCRRHKRQNAERVERVLLLLREHLAEPPSLEEIGRRVGCSHFYLSRIFSQEMGCGIFQYLRRLRMERAAELLKGGGLNVTEVAMEVGYSSPSHFSTAFHETFGCCPGLYPLAPAVKQRCPSFRGSTAE